MAADTAHAWCSRVSERGRTSPHQPARERTVLRAPPPTDGVAFLTSFTAFFAAVLACAQAMELRFGGE